MNGQSERLWLVAEGGQSNRLKHQVERGRPFFGRRARFRKGRGRRWPRGGRVAVRKHVRRGAGPLVREARPVEHAPDGTPTSPAYPFAAPGADIALHDGPLALDDRPGMARIWLGTRGGLDHRWELQPDDGRTVPLGDYVLSFDHARLGPVTVAGRATSTAGRGTVLSSGLGSCSRLDEAVVHWIALPALPGSTGLSTTNAAWSGRCTLTGGGWDMTIDARIDHHSVAEAAAGTPDLAVTHTGLLRRADRTPFTPEQAEDALYAWQIVLSFALGRWVAPTLAAGSRAGRPVWELWAEWRCSDWTHNYAWWDTHDRAGLDEISGLLLDAWTNAARRDTLRHVAHHIVEANERRTTLEARIMLVGAALEYISWDTHVLRGGRSGNIHSRRKASRTSANSLKPPESQPRSPPTSTTWSASAALWASSAPPRPSPGSATASSTPRTLTSRTA